MSDHMFEKFLMLKDKEKSVETIINALHGYTYIVQFCCM